MDVMMVHVTLHKEWQILTSVLDSKSPSVAHLIQSFGNCLLSTYYIPASYNLGSLPPSTPPLFFFQSRLKATRGQKEALGNLGVLAPPLLPLALSAPPITTQRRLLARNEDRKQSSLVATPASGFKPCS